MKALGWKVERDISNQLTVVGFKRFTNIIATLDPSAKSRIVLACHYDSKLFPLGFVGAMDSAVPCAMMINLARRFDPILKMIKPVSFCVPVPVSCQFILTLIINSWMYCIYMKPRQRKEVWRSTALFKSHINIGTYIIRV